MVSKDQLPETLDELRDLNVAAAFRERRVGNRAPDPATQEICDAICFAADVVRRTIIATHDVIHGDHEYNP